MNRCLLIELGVLLWRTFHRLWDVIMYQYEEYFHFGVKRDKKLHIIPSGTG